MLASTWTDMVMGVDIHFEMVPMPAPVPTPIPNPFIGMVFDPAGLAIGLAIGAGLSLAFGGPVTGPVLIYGLPATNVGTEAKGVGHILIPPGTMWAPMPKFPKPSFKGPPEFPGLPVKPEDDAVSIMGSKTVNVMGSSQVRMGELFMSCGEPLRLPSSTVIAIPKGSPVLVGGPPAVDLLTALTSMIKTKWVAGYFHSLASRIKSDRLRNIANKVICFVTGHPVDVATGRVMTDHVDWELPGPLPLRFERSYASSWSHRSGPLGHGWSHSLDQGLWSERGKIVYLAEDGREIEFDTFDLPQHKLPPGVDLFEPINRLTLRLDLKGGASITTHDGIRHEFVKVPGSTGERQHWLRLKSISNRAGHSIEIDYDRRGNIEWVRDSGGRQVCLEHDAQGRLTLVKLPHPTERAWLPHTRYAYDPNGDLVQVTDPLGHSWHFKYKNHLLVQETDRNGLSFYFAYDGHTKDAFCVRTWGDGGIYDHVIDYDKKGKKTFVTNSLGHTTVYHMNPVGCVVSVIDPLGATTQFEYDERTLQRTKKTDPLGGETLRSYDARGNCINTSFPDGSEVQRSYDGENQCVSATNAIGGVWRWTYDHRGQVKERTAPDGTRQILEYTSGLLTSVSASSGARISLSYDEEGNLSGIVDPVGGTLEYQTDRLGRWTRRKGRDGRTVRQFYNGLGQVVRVETELGGVREIERGPEGEVLRCREGTRDVRYRYTGFRQIASVEEAGHLFQFTYDTEGRLTSTINERGEVFAFDLDKAGRPRTERTFDGRFYEFEHDLAGRITGVREPSGESTTHAYDALGRLLERMTPDGTSTRFKYRADGALMQAEVGDHVVAYERDPLGRILKESADGVWVGSEYDTNGARTRMWTSEGAETSIRRDPAGRATQVTCSEGGLQQAVVSFQRDSAGRATRLELPGNQFVEWSASEGSAGFERRSGTKSRAGHDTRRARSYFRASPSKINRIVDSELGPRQFEHDARGNLIIERRDPDESLGRFVDAAGNVYRSPGLDDRQYDSGGRLVRDADVTYEYDQLGRRVAKVTPEGTWRYGWNGQGLLASVELPDGSRVENHYDAFARRTRKRVYKMAANGEDSLEEEVTFVWDGHLLVHEISSREGRTTWDWSPETLHPLLRRSNEGVAAIGTDLLGAPLEILSSNGTVEWAGEVDVSGAIRTAHGNVRRCPWRFAGQYADRETGLYNNRWRHYDPLTGTYLSPDPIGLLGRPATYSYVPDPLVQIDPFGLDTSSDAAILRDNMVSNGMTEPDFPNSAHHIVQSNSTDPAWSGARQHMEDLGMDVNSHHNGVFLPTSTAAKTAAGSDALAHSRVHTNAYRDYVTDRVQQCKSLDELVDTLGDIRGKLESGEAINKPPCS